MRVTRLRWRLRRFPFHTMTLNAVGWAALVGGALPLVALLMLVGGLPLWLSVIASIMLTVAIVVVFDRLKEAASWIRRSTNLTELELETVVVELRALGIDVQVSRFVIPDGPEHARLIELVLQYRHHDRQIVEQVLATRRRDR